MVQMVWVIVVKKSHLIIVINNSFLLTICMYYRTMEPTPLDPLVLHGQRTHRVSFACAGVSSKELHC